jgi:hypothetical protein
MAYGCSNRIVPKTRDKTPIENIAIRPAFRMGRYGDRNARPPRIPLIAKAASIRKTPSETIVAASDAVRPRAIVAIRSAPARYSAVLRSAGDLMMGYVWF